MVENSHGFKVTKVAINPTDNKVVIVGTQEGNVL